MRHCNMRRFLFHYTSTIKKRPTAAPRSITVTMMRIASRSAKKLNVSKKFSIDVPIFCQIVCYQKRKVIHYILCRGGEMADAPALGAGGSNPVEVQVLSPAPKQNLTAFSKPNGGARGARPPDFPPFFQTNSDFPPSAGRGFFFSQNRGGR